MASHFGHSKVTKCLENGLFWDQESVKNGSKMCLSKDTFGLFGVHKQVALAHFEPMLSNFGPSQGRNGLENWANLERQMAQKQIKTMIFQN